MRKLVVAVIVLLVLLVGADFAARAYAESRTADAIRSEVGTDVTPDVSIEGFPFLWHAVQGSYPQVVITASTTSVTPCPWQLSRWPSACRWPTSPALWATRVR